MGARAQVKIEDTGVFLYTHWGSRDIVEDVRTVIRRGKRLSDPEYLARIVFDQMTLGRQGQDTGAGIGASQHGDIDVLVTIDTTKRTVRVDDIWEKTSTTQTFQEFAQ
jgi:hypothetical protein